MMTQRTLVLVRVGEGLFDAEGRITGDLDVPHSARGRLHLSALRMSLAGVSLDALLSGPGTRCQETSLVVAAATGGRPKFEPELREMHLGLWQGLSVEEARQRYKRAFRRFERDARGVHPPEGEHLEDVAARALAIIDRALPAGKERTVALVLAPLVHGILAGRLRDRPLDDLWAQQLAGAPLAFIDYERAIVLPAAKPRHTEPRLTPLSF